MNTIIVIISICFSNLLSCKLEEIDLYSLFIIALNIGIACAIILIILLLVAEKNKSLWNFFSKNLSPMFCIAWIVGFAVYDVGMCTGDLNSLYLNAPMALLHAFGMFILNSDVSAIHEVFHNNTLFMACFSVSHFFAAFISMVFVIKHFGYNIIAGIRMSLAAYFLRKKDITYVFWGINDATYYLAQSIKKHHETDNYRTIIVRTDNDNKDIGGRNSIERLFNFLSLKDEDVNRLSKLECYTTSTFGNLLSSDNGKTNLIKKDLNMKQLCQIIQNKTYRELHMFFLSEDEEANIRSVANMKKDLTINDFVVKGERQVKLYCHTRNNSIHRVIANDQPINGIEVKIVDLSQICVNLLKHNPDFHPVNYVNVEQDATVSSPFNALVIGFGQVGIEIVRFLYEFSAFVKTGSTNVDVRRSAFHCHVVDKNMHDIAGSFVANSPSIKVSMPFKSQEPIKDSLISLHEMDCQSLYFYEMLESWIKDLNYIVIATGDDNLNISLSVRILRLAIRYKENLDHFRILVKVSHDDSGHIRNIAAYYNRLWEAEQKKDVNDNAKRQKVIPSNMILDTPITLFGTIKETYQYEYIISDKLKDMAKMFKERYDKSIRELQIVSGNTVDTIVSWDDEYNRFMQLEGDYAGYAPTYSNIMKLHRTQSQNLENSFHIHTKQRLAMYALDAEEYATLAKHQFFRKDNDIKYQYKSHVKDVETIIKVLDTLAQTEHLRWNASHEILGYQAWEDEFFKDEAKLIHGCMKNWQDLAVITQSYDYNVVDVSLGIIAPEIKE